MSKILKQFAGKNYGLAKWLWQRNQRNRISACDHQPIINYQMGKVGSSTVQASLSARLVGHPVYHIHFLNPLRTGALEQQRRKHFGTGREGYLKRAWLCEFLYKEIQKQNRHWKLITLVREPIARNISTFFENIKVESRSGTDAYVVSSDYYGFDEIEIGLDDITPLIELFFDRLVHERPLKYFDDELKAVFGIDIFTSKFPQQTGYQLLKAKNADLLIFRLDYLDQCASRAFKEFLAIDDFHLLQTNVGSEKVYAPLYKEFKRSIRIPKEYIDQMYTSRFARHFYSEEELQQFGDKWAG